MKYYDKNYPNKQLWYLNHIFHYIYIAYLSISIYSYFV